MYFLNKAVIGHYYTIFKINKNGTFKVINIKSRKVNMRILQGKICEIYGKTYTAEEALEFLQEVNDTRKESGMKGEFRIVMEMENLNDQEICRVELFK